MLWNDCVRVTSTVFAGNGVMHLGDDALFDDASAFVAGGLILSGLLLKDVAGWTLLKGG